MNGCPHGQRIDVKDDRFLVRLAHRPATKPCILFALLRACQVLPISFAIWKRNVIFFDVGQYFVIECLLQRLGPGHRSGGVRVLRLQVRGHPG